jgi:pyruvate dehydrogenase E2 component (dihydrolipoamide acetyltransferase)
MPVLGLTMEEGTVAEWLKHEGQGVTRDEPLLMVEMDKGTVEVPAPASGILLRIVVKTGTTVPVRTLIAEIGEPDEVIGVPSNTAPGGVTPGLTGGQPMPAAGMPNAGGPGALPPRGASPGGERAAARERIFASPRARMRARALGVELSDLRGSGPLGRIVEADVLGWTPIAVGRVVATPVARRLAHEHGVAIEAIQGSGPGGRITQDDVLAAAGRHAQDQPRVADAVAPQVAQTAAETRRIAPLGRVRRITAERMIASAQTTARVSLFLEADFSEVSRFRAQLQPEFARLGVEKLPWDAIFARAAALALVEHPAVAAQWVEGHGLWHPAGTHVGVAVTLEPEGLVVPVLRDADQRSLRELAQALLGLVERARAGRLSPDEMQGGTFSITNLGAYRVDGFTPILNPPETAILGVGRIADKAVVIDGKLEARPMCTLSLSFDHRVVDGAPAATFLARLAELLERPYALLGI